MPPRRMALLMALGPCFVWCGEYIGSGEVILATRNGAIFGTAILWVPVMAIFLKYCIGLAGAHYTVTTGEGMIDMMARTPGPKNWVLWPVFIGQLCSGAIATGALASVTGVFARYFIPLPEFVLAWMAVAIVIALVWSGLFAPIQRAMTILVLVIVIGACFVAYETWPGVSAILAGFFGFKIPPIPEWLPRAEGAPPATPWREIMPLLGWAAGGFASQVWYTYWVIGAGYGMTRDRGYGKPLDPKQLAAITVEDAERLRGWRTVVTFDATTALFIGSAVTCAFMIAGSGVLGPLQIAPTGPSVALELSKIFGSQWGQWGASLFILAGLAAMMSTMIGQFGGWLRLLEDCARLLFPKVASIPWKTQFQFVLILYAFSNMVIAYQFGLEPVILVKTGAILDGLLLTPLQALAIGLNLYIVMPRFFAPEVRPLIRANKLLGVGLIAAFIVYGYFCVVQIPKMLSE